MTERARFQLFDALPPAIEDALRESIRRFGVLVPVTVDQDGAMLDGHHRARIATDLGVPYDRLVHHCADDDERREIARTLNSDRRQLTSEQRQSVVVALAEAGHSNRAIAGALGVGETTVRRDLSTAPDGAVRPERTVGKDGKSRPARRAPRVLARNDREQERAQQALAIAADVAPGRTLDIKRIERIARDHAPAEGTPERVAMPPTCDIRLGDFREVLADVPDGSVDLILTDPPYPSEFLPLWSGLGELAARVLRPGGLLAAMSGRTHLPDVMARLGEHLPYRWTMAYLMPGRASVVHARAVSTQWKPILVYGSSETVRFHDVVSSDEGDKSHHDWGQSESGMRALVAALAEPGAVVLDPFMGAGTTGVAAIRDGYCSRFIGVDIDGLAVGKAERRLAPLVLVA